MHQPILKLTFIHLTIFPFIGSFSIFESFIEFSNIIRSIIIDLLSLPLWFPIDKITNISHSFSQIIQCSIPIKHWLFEFTIIKRAVIINIHSFSFSISFLKLSIIKWSIFKMYYSFTLWVSSWKIALVCCLYLLHHIDWLIESRYSLAILIILILFDIIQSWLCCFTQRIMLCNRNSKWSQWFINKWP